MKKIITILVVAFFALVSVAPWGCKKDNDNNTDNPEDSTRVNNFFIQHMAPSQYFSVNLQTDHIVVGNHGTQICFDQYSFSDLSGNIVSGNVQFELKEIYSKKEMILSNVTTMSDDGLLESGGMIYLRVTQNGNTLEVTAGHTLTLKFPKPDDGTNNVMRTYYGYYNEENNSYKWRLPDSITDPSAWNSFAWPTPDSTSYTDFSYVLYTSDLGWINCDYFYGQSPLTDIEVTVPTDYNFINTAVIIVFSNQNLAARFYIYNNHIFSLGAPYMVPVGIAATIVTFSQIGNDYYSSFTPLTVQNGQTLSVIPIVTTLVDFETALNAL